MIGPIYRSNLLWLALDSCDIVQGMEHVEMAEDGRQMVLLRAAALVSEPCTLSTQPAQPAAEPPRIALQISEGEVSFKGSKEHGSLFNWIRLGLSRATNLSVAAEFEVLLEGLLCIGGVIGMFLNYISLGRIPLLTESSLTCVYFS